MPDDIDWSSTGLVRLQLSTHIFLVHFFLNHHYTTALWLFHIICPICRGDKMIRHHFFILSASSPTLYLLYCPDSLTSLFHSCYINCHQSLLFPIFFSYLMQLACLKIIFTAAIQKAFPQVESQEFGVGIITRCGNPSFGDFQCNNSLAIAKYFKTFCNYTGEGKIFSHNSFFFS